MPRTRNAMEQGPHRHIVSIGPVYPYRGGIAQFLETMHATLQARGHTSALVSFRRQYPDLLFPGKTQYTTDPPTTPVEAPRLIDTLNPWSWFKTARAVIRQKPEVLVFMHWMPFFAPAYGFIAWRVRKQGIRVLAVVHNALPHEPRPGDRMLSRYFLKACDGLVVLSSTVEAEIEQLGITVPVVRSHHPVYDRFGPLQPRVEARDGLGLPQDAPVLLFFGFIRKYKGLQVLLDAMPAVLARRPDVRLVIAGEFYENEAEYRTQIDRLGLKEALHLHAEYIPEDQVPVFFSAADVVVQPYLSASQSGIAQVAYHFERPLIVTAVGALPEVVPHEEAGLVVPPKAPGALANAIVHFFDGNLSQPLTEGVRRQKKRYSWAGFCEALEGLMA